MAVHKLLYGIEVSCKRNINIKQSKAEETRNVKEFSRLDTIKSCKKRTECFIKSKNIYFNVTSCSLIDLYRSFERTSCLHLQERAANVQATLNYVTTYFK